MTNATNIDHEVEQVRDVLQTYNQDHSAAQIEVKRQNIVSLRVRVIDPDFEGIDRADREPDIWDLLATLPEEVRSNVTMLLLLTPDEAKESLASQEFDDPIPSRL